MSDVPLVWVDAFTDRSFAGNPAAVCLLEGPADEGWMQALATELGLSETAYAWGEGLALSLRWFTPVAEVDLCGHATLATAHALRRAGRAGDGDDISFATRSGVLVARLCGDLIELDLPADSPVPTEVPASLVPMGALAAARGRTDLMVELADAEALRTVVADLGAIAGLDVRGVCATARGEEGSGIDYVLRFFAPSLGLDEDPVTGSAQCLLGPYWSQRLGQATLEVAQLSRRGGRLRVTVVGDRVTVAGQAVTIVEGRVTPS